MKEWTIKVFRKLNGEDPFEDWMQDQDRGARAKIRARLDMMSITKTWERPYVGNLKDHIHEIILEHNNKQYRPLFCYGTGRLIILLVGATKKGGRRRGPTVWTPPDAIEIAKTRRNLIVKDGRYIGDYEPREKKIDGNPQGQRI